jgi:hypothetical protein
MADNLVPIVGDAGMGAAGGVMVTALLQIIWKLVQTQQAAGADNKDIEALRATIKRLEEDVDRTRDYLRLAEQDIAAMKADIRTLLATQPNMDKVLDMLARISRGISDGPR